MRSGTASIVLALLLACTGTGGPVDRMEVPRNLLNGYPARTADGLVYAIVEIPAGTNAKWETTKDGSALAWARKEGKLRVVRYLAYPANYGMVPGTLLSKEEGGDGDPLDVVVLGPARPRGEVVEARLVGVLRLLDGGEQDDKLLAVDPNGPLGEVRTLADLEHSFPGATLILETWFAHYKGPGEIETRGFGEREEAFEILDRAERAFSGASN